MTGTESLMFDEDISMQPVNHTDTHNLYMTSDDVFVVEERETGMKYHVNDHKKAYMMMEGVWENVKSSEGRARKLGHESKSLSIEEKLEKQSEILDKFGDRLVKFLAKSSPHEEAFGLDAKGLLIQCVRKIENGEVLSKERLQELEEMFGKMKV